MKAWFARFSLRDQVALLVLAAAVLLYLLLQLLVMPLAEAREEMRSRNLATAELLSRVDRMAAELRALRAGEGERAGATGANLNAVLNASANRFALRVSRLQPNGRGAVQLRFETAALDALLRWIHELETSQGLVVEELSLSQTSDAGVVSATLRVASLN